MTSKNGHVPLPFPYGSLDRGIRTAVRTLFEKSRLLNPARVEAGHALTAHDEMSANLYCVGRTARGRTGPQSRLVGLPQSASGCRGTRSGCSTGARAGEQD